MLKTRDYITVSASFMNMGPGVFKLIIPEIFWKVQLQWQIVLSACTETTVPEFSQSSPQSQ